MVVDEDKEEGDKSRTVRVTLRPEAVNAGCDASFLNKVASLAECSMDR